MLKLTKPSQILSLQNCLPDEQISTPDAQITRCVYGLESSYSISTDGTRGVKWKKYAPDRRTPDLCHVQADTVNWHIAEVMVYRRGFINPIIRATVGCFRSKIAEIKRRDDNAVKILLKSSITNTIRLFLW